MVLKERPTCEPVGSEPGHAASRPDLQQYPSPGEPWRDEKTGKPEGSSDMEPAVAVRRRGLRKLPSVGEHLNGYECIFPRETAAREHERFLLVGCEAVMFALTTSGDSMSCRKECRFRVVRGFGMVVSWQRSEFRELLDEL